jgi:hypothetical protein
MFFFYDFWIGKDSELDKYWDAYYKGEDYKQKFLDMKSHDMVSQLNKNSSITIYDRL